MATSLFNTTPTYPATFVQPLGERIADFTASELNRPIDIQGIMPQVAGIDPFTQAAQQRGANQAGLGTIQYDPQGRNIGFTGGTGIAAYEPYLQQAQSMLSPTSYQQYMSPYQQDIINTTLSEYDRQAQRGIAPLNAQATNYGNLGSARQGVQQAEYLAASDRNRAGLQAGLLGQGFNAAQGLNQQGISNLFNLAQGQQGFEQGVQNQLGGLGTQSQAYNQNILNAAQQGNQIQNEYPLARLSGITSLFGNLAQATPGEPGTPLLTNPSLTAAQAFANIYGAMNPARAGTGTATGQTAAGGGNGIMDIINTGNSIYNAGKGAISWLGDKIFG